MTPFILTAVLLIYGANGQPVTSTSVTAEYNSRETCMTALEYMGKNIKDGALTFASCTQK